MGGATAGALIQQAALAIDAGMANVVACVFGDTARTGGARFDAPAGRGDSSGNLGHVRQRRQQRDERPAAHGALRHDQRAARLGRGDAAASTPRSTRGAVMREPITIEDHQASRGIVDPLHLLDCCLISDGGVAVIVTSAERARTPGEAAGRTSWGMGQGHTLQTLEHPDWWYLPHQRDAVSMAYRMAGVGPSDIDVAQLYDNFTRCRPVLARARRVLRAGRVRAVRRGRGANHLRRRAARSTPPGGNLSESYMQGWLHVVEGVRQVRGESGERQVDGCRGLPGHRSRDDPQHVERTGPREDEPYEPRPAQPSTTSTGRSGTAAARAC